MAELTEKTEWVDGIYQLETSDPVMGGPGGISNRQANQLANRTAYLKQQAEQTGNALAQHATAANPHPQYAPLASPVLTGTPTAPTAAAGSNTTQLATTAFVSTATANLSASTANGLAQKIDLAEIVGIPLPWPQATAPAGWLKCNGQAFDKAVYPRLAQVYPSGVLPDLRGEFIRGWDDGRGVDVGRVIMSSQGDAIRNIVGFINGTFVRLDGYTGAFYDNGNRASSIPTAVSNGNTNDDISFDASRVVPTAADNRPRNIAFNYIVRAA
ncbi:phage tail protein [Dickeya oryzae]|uniref:phage tail protein n=1 Tax=Dickeya oryzae TaxID=1240404 RepID=UPI001AECD76B|nr:phage tail protein [Dickeya oryzae]MBP2848770.1 tail fiber protein [Dickeya oryzae]